jgi:hypothetical protein
MREKPRHASRADVIRIHKRLEEVLKPMADGFWSYPDDMTDLSIAKELDVGKASVSGLRMELFGRLFKPKTLPRSSKFGDMQKAIRDLQAVVEEIKIKHNKLCSAVHVQLAIDCRHLEIKSTHIGNA